jgi:hypothetical protein
MSNNGKNKCIEEAVVLEVWNVQKIYLLGLINSMLTNNLTLCNSRKVAGSNPDEVDYFQLT